ARDHEPVQRRGKDRPFHRERECTATDQPFDHRSTAALLPQPAEHQRSTDASRRGPIERTLAQTRHQHRRLAQSRIFAMWLPAMSSRTTFSAWPPEYSNSERGTMRKVDRVCGVAVTSVHVGMAVGVAAVSFPIQAEAAPGVATLGMRTVIS